MRYFKDRQEAGRLLAEKLINHAKENSAVVALSEGGVVVGAEIAMKLHTSLFLLTTENLKLPGETDPFASMSTEGTFTYNSGFSTGDIEAIKSDFHTLIEQSRIETFQKLNRISAEQGQIPKTLLKNHTVIIVSDGLLSGLSLDVVADFLKPIKLKKLIIATPIASVQAVDKMHSLADEICCLSVPENLYELDHYYENNKLPSHQEIIKTMENIIVNWPNN